MVNANMKSKGDINKLKEDMSELLKSDVYIGIPEANAPRLGEAVSNAQLAFIHTLGSELQNIPARPFIEPTIEKNKNKIADAMKKAATLAMDGDSIGMQEEFEKIGLIVSTKAKEYFTDPNNGWAPNSPRTIAEKGSDRPLIDTSSLRNSITYVVAEK